LANHDDLVTIFLFDQGFELLSVASEEPFKVSATNHGDHLGLPGCMVLLGELFLDGMGDHGSEGNGG
jgi:hypothetical protein